jgi:hypothetical protein
MNVSRQQNRPVVTLAATLLQAEDVESNLYSVEPVEPLQGDKVPTAFAVAHPKVAAKVRDASLQSDEESLVASSSSYEEFYNAAYRKMQTLVQSGKKADECIKAAESSISSVLQEFKTTQKMLDNLDDGAKCTKKGQHEIKRAEYRWRKATKILETTNFKRKETDKDSCKKEVTAKEYQKTSLKEYVHAKKVAIELRRQCKCAVINNVHQLVQFSKTLIKVRAKTVVRETVLVPPPVLCSALCLTNIFCGRFALLRRRPKRSPPSHAGAKPSFPAWRKQPCRNSR